MKMGWICDNDEENHKYKSKTTATTFEIQTWGIHPPPPPLPQEGLFIIIIIIIVIIISILYLPAFEALAVSYSLAVQLVYGQVKLLMSLRMLSSHFET